MSEVPNDGQQGYGPYARAGADPADAEGWQSPAGSVPGTPGALEEPTRAVPSIPAQGQPGRPGTPGTGIGPVPPDPGSYAGSPPYGPGITVPAEAHTPVQPRPAAGMAYPAEPVSGAPDALFDDVRPSWQPRITPSPPPQRGKLLLAMLAGLLAGLVVFGVSGFFAGRWTADEAGGAVPAPTAAGDPTATLPAYEQSLAELNRVKFTGELAAFGEAWLPHLGDCVKNGERNGPRLYPGEASRVACDLGSIQVYFVQFASIADRDKTRIRNLGQNVDARQLTPGVASGTEKETPSERTAGSYVEYAYQVEQNAGARTVAALWWDDADTPIGAYLLAYWKDVGESWEPMRDVWSRYA